MTIPPLNGLRAFEAAARHRNVTRAAEELHVTQSAVSHQIRNLEDALGLDLFERSGGRLALTEAGQILLPGVSEAFATLQRALSSLQASRQARPLGVVTRSHFALKWLAPRLVRFWERHPGFDLRLQHSNHPADFARPEIDLAIEWRHRDDLPANARLLLEGDLTPAYSPGLAANGQSIVQPADLASTALLHEADEVAWRAWLTLAEVGDLAADRNHYYDDTNVRHQATLAGEGVSLACPHLIQDDLEAGRLLCPFDIRLTDYAYYLVTPEVPRNPQAPKFVAWLLDEAGLGGPL